MHRSLAPDGLPTIAVVSIYVIALVVLARHADRGRPSPKHGMRHAIVYAFSLAALCTSWIYYGTVGLAVRTGWNFLPNLIGPIVGFVILWPIWRRIAIAAKRENSSSVADFIASRYGKSRRLGALVAIVAIVGALPYIALQILSLSKSITVIAGGTEPAALTIPLIVGALIGVAILFGARRPMLTQHNRGLTRVVAADAVVKLGALTAVAALALWLMVHAPRPISFGKFAHPPVIDASFLVWTLLCTGTTFALPRMFHLGIVALERPDDLRVGRWLFPAYLAAWAAAIVPIAIVGAALSMGEPNMVVLRLPRETGGGILTALAFLGGFSAAATMVTVEAIALSAMISNELILPWLARKHLTGRLGQDVSTLVVRVRRGAIVAIVALSYIHFRAMPPTSDLSKLGFASLAASAQLVPALFGAVLWRRGHASGAFWGIVAGMVAWLALVELPQIAGPGIAPQAIGEPGLFNLGVVTSLILNVTIYVTVSLRAHERLIDRIQADAFVGEAALAPARAGRQLHGNVGELRALLARFVGEGEARRGLGAFGRELGQAMRDDAPVTPAVARMAERMLAGAIGASSARNVVALALADNEQDAADVRHILDEAAHAVLFSREILHSALNGIDEGISVVDRDLRLVAWNQRYLELFRYPASDTYVGQPLEEVIAIGARHSGFSPEEGRALLAERIEPIRRREPQLFERRWPNGRIFRIMGQPLPGGEYVTSFSDVTEIRAAEQTLAQVNEALEERVEARTRELREANRALVEANAALAEAKALADRIVAAQKSFVAAASHDLLQPLHAARLYLGTAAELRGAPKRQRQLVTSADLSIEAADRLLKALLNLSRIEIGDLAPDCSAVNLAAMLAALECEFGPVAAGAGLVFRVAPTMAWVRSDPDLLRSVLQNLIGNAIRYTGRGSVFVGVRREGTNWRIEVRDNGPGLSEGGAAAAFRAFTRVPETSGGTTGAGLGLAIAQRICAVLGHRLAVQSARGRGSVFSVSLATTPTIATPAAAPRRGLSLAGQRVLCLDDRRDVLDALRQLLERWGAEVEEASTVDEALTIGGSFGAAIADLHLGEERDGLYVLAALGNRAGCRLLLTANISDEVRRRADALGIAVLRKPVSPGALRALLAESVRTTEAVG